MPRYGYCIGPDTYKFDTQFGSVIWSNGDVQIIINKDKARLDITKTLYWNNAGLNSKQSLHTCITIIDLVLPKPGIFDVYPQDRIKLFHDPEKTQLTFKDETEQSVTLHYTWKPNRGAIDIGRIPHPGEIRIGA